MRSIVIAKDSLAYAAKIGGGVISGINEVNLLADGAVAVFTDKSEMVTAANVATILIDKKGIYFAVGSGAAATGAYITPHVIRWGAGYVKRAYQAPLKQVQFIGFNGTTGSLNLPTLIAGAEAFVKIVNRTENGRIMGTMYVNEIKSYNYVVKTGDTDTIVVNAIVTAINNDPDSQVVAAVVSTTPTLGISLTNKLFGTVMELALDGIFVNATKTDDGTNGSVVVRYGEGTYDQVLALEDSYSPGRGNTNKLMQAALWYSAPKMAVSGKTYDQYAITWTGMNNRETGSQTTVNNTLNVALPVGVAAQATFETIMAQVFGVEEEAESGA